MSTRAQGFFENFIGSVDTKLVQYFYKADYMGRDSPLNELGEWILAMVI